MTNCLSFDLDARLANVDRMNVEFAEIIKSQCFCHQADSFSSVFVDQGLYIWKHTLESSYPRFPISPSVMNLRQSSLWKNGFVSQENFLDSSSCSALVSAFDPNKPCQLPSQNLIASITNSVQSWQDTYLPEGLVLIPWRSHVYMMNSTSSSASCKWHYDLEQPDTSVFMLLYLNDPFTDTSGTEEDSAWSGTAIIDAYQSMLVSSYSGYIGAPVAHRVDSFASQLFNPRPIETSVVASTGKALFFQPGRCLHRAHIPHSGDRYILHIAFTIAPSDVLLHNVISNSLETYHRSSFDRMLSGSFDHRQEKLSVPPLPIRVSI